MVITELATIGEEPDAIGWHGTHSTLIECKASRSDFLADRRKFFRKFPENGIGQHRYYLTIPGVIAVKDLPAKWGLMEFTACGIKVVRQSELFPEANHRQEISILLSTIRRLGHLAPKGCSIRFYTIDSKNRASVGVSQDDPQPEPEPVVLLLPEKRDRV